jgi:hypothetical protein
MTATELHGFFISSPALFKWKVVTFILLSYLWVHKLTLLLPSTLVQYMHHEYRENTWNEWCKVLCVYYDNVAEAFSLCNMLLWLYYMWVQCCYDSAFLNFLTTLCHWTLRLGIPRHKSRARRTFINLPFSCLQGKNVQLDMMGFVNVLMKVNRNQGSSIWRLNVSHCYISIRFVSIFCSKKELG